jgi:hypothetical protein
MRKDVYSPSQMDKAIQFLNPLFDNNNELFKALLKEKLAYLDGKNFTYILDQRSRKTKCESEFRRGTCTFRSKTTQELQNSRFQDANFPLNTFFRSQLCRITKN